MKTESKRWGPGPGGTESQFYKMENPVGGQWGRRHDGVSVRMH